MFEGVGDASKSPDDRPLELVDLQPPQDILAEQCVLGGMLLSKDAIADVVEVLVGADFYRPAHQTIYDAMVELYGRGQPVDAVTVADELTRTGELTKVGGAAYLFTLVSCVPTAANAGYYAHIVADRAVLRRLIEAGTRIVQLSHRAASGSADVGEVDQVVDRAQASVFDVTERRAGEDYRRLEDVLPATLDEIEAVGRRGGVPAGVLTGFRELDQLTGGLHPGQLIVVAARPSIGKSTLGLDFARAASIKQRLTAVLYSLEMSCSEITMRLLSAESRVPMQAVRAGLLKDEEWARLVHRMGEVADAPLYIDDSPNLTMMALRAKARRLKQRHDLRLVIVDYLQLMSSPRRTESRQQEVADMSRSLKLLAKELDLPVVAISQLNRNPEQRQDKRPQLSDLRESGAIEMDADVVILLHREDRYEPETTRAGEADLIVAKQRNGPIGTIAVAFRRNYSMFADLASGVG
jgi:replicative DNA helicase